MMILKKWWLLIASFLNKLTNKARTIDPIAQLDYEIDVKADQLKEGRVALEMCRGLYERVKHQVEDGQAHILELKAQVNSYIASGDRETAGKFALELQQAEKNWAENMGQLKIHQTTYENNLEKLKFATRKITELRNHKTRQDANLRFSRVEKEIAKLGEALNFDAANPTTDLGQIERIIQDEIDSNRAAVQVAADLSGNGIEAIRRDHDVEKQRAEIALQQFEAKGITHEISAGI